MALTQDPAQNPPILFSQKTTDAQTGEGQGWERASHLVEPTQEGTWWDSQVADSKGAGGLTPTGSQVGGGGTLTPKAVHVVTSGPARWASAEGLVSLKFPE